MLAWASFPPISPRTLVVSLLDATNGSRQVLIAACDTFRSGAVEQLRVHCRCLDVPLFEKGKKGFVVGEARFSLRMDRRWRK